MGRADCGRTHAKGISRLEQKVMFQIARGLAKTLLDLITFLHNHKTPQQGREQDQPGSVMNLRHIEVFHAVYSVGSISGASRLLNVSQPSVSKIVKHAESRLGFRLFTLVRGRLTPTEEAHILFREVDDLHSRIDTFQRAARNLRSPSEGHIRIGVLPSLALAKLPRAISVFRQKWPRVTFEVSAIHHDEFRAALMSRECDFVIGYHAVGDPEIAAFSLGQGCVGALFVEGMFDRDLSAIPIDLLRSQELIGLAPSVSIGDLIAPVMAGTLKSTPAIQVKSVYIAAALARSGSGVAIVDQFTAQAFVGDDLHFRPIEPAVTFGLSVQHLSAHPLSRVARSFTDLMAGMIEAQGPSAERDDCRNAMGARQH
nr:LysR family transcriptional regulator [uncultured Sphingomonas sp.]